ncbi:MAG: four helix bundle protein [Terriglobia bacterium]
MKKVTNQKIVSHRDLQVYNKSFEAALRVHSATKLFPNEEMYSLTDQLRRSSRSVRANLAEAWRKRRYEAAFISKLNDVEAEAAETQTWIEFAVSLNYLSKEAGANLQNTYEEIICTIIGMISHSKSWVLPSGRK